MIEELEKAKARMPPDDAILLVDDPRGCPIGWRDMGADEEQQSFFAGRMIVAVGDSKGDGPYEYRDRGGAATHELTEAELPKLSGAANVRSALPLLSSLETIHANRANSGSSEAGVTSRPQGMRFATGAVVPRDDSKVRATIFRFSDAASYLTIDVPNPGRNVPHNNMPPYIALYFCKKLTPKPEDG